MIHVSERRVVQADAARAYPPNMFALAEQTSVSFPTEQQPPLVCTFAAIWRQ